MAHYLTAELELQVGKEASDAWGTAVAPTAKLQGITSVDIRTIEDGRQLEEIRGTLYPAYQSIIARKGAEATIEGLVLYEDVAYWLDSMFDVPTTDNGKFTTDATYPTRSYQAPGHSSDIAETRSNTLVYGDVTNVWGMTGAVVNTLSISGGTGEPIAFTAEMIGKTVTSDTLDSDTSDSDRTVTVCMGDHAVLSIDLDSDAVGGTPVSDCAYSFELVLNANRAPLHHMGDQTPGTYRNAPWSGTLSLLLELNATSAGYLDAIIDATTEPIGKNVRLKFSSGSHYLQIDFGGRFLEVPELFGDEDGVISANLVLTGEQTEGMTTSWCVIEAKTNVVTLP